MTKPSISEYLYALIQTDQQAKQRLDSLLQEGLESGESFTPDDSYWSNKKKHLKQKH